MPAFVGGASNNSITSFELAVSNLPPPYPPPLPTQSSSRSGKDSRIGDLVAGPLASSHPGMDHSTAVDARLEAGVSLLSELRLHMMAAVHTSRLSLAVTAPLKVNNGMWGDTEVCGPGDLTGSVELLTDVFQKILLHLSMQFDGSHVESVLGVAQHQLGACRGQVRSLCCPNCAPNTKSHLSTLGCSCQKWKRQHAVLVSCAADAYTLLQLYATGTHAPHPTSADQYDHVDLTGMSMNIVTDTNFVPALQKLLTGSCATGSDMRSDVVGSTVTGLLEDLLVRLRVRCDVISVTSGPGTTLKHALLSLVARLLEPQGAISLAMGPLDAQCCLLGTLLSMHYDGLDRMHVDFFASVLGSDGRQGQRLLVWLLCSLLNLSRKLAQTPLVNPAQVRVGVANYEAQENSGGPYRLSKLEQQRTDASSSQTDDTKPCIPPDLLTCRPKQCSMLGQIQTPSHINSHLGNLLAVLQNGETKLLLKSVAACEGSSVSMLLGTVSGRSRRSCA
ncbi:hypothetical protein C7M84_016940 [Penaeus vannamei]|uniref:Uncharacterized protein n=1 Tax=Penaeus vannamei TaxID=6689 RepID=A0A3R7QES5_PENVA|nr:hypothetical protein C7M84_016940 [Penaeus vannamei]